MVELGGVVVIVVDVAVVVVAGEVKADCEEVVVVEVVMEHQV